MCLNIEPRGIYAKTNSDCDTTRQKKKLALDGHIIIIGYKIPQPLCQEETKITIS